MVDLSQERDEQRVKNTHALLIHGYGIKKAPVAQLPHNIRAPFVAHLGAEESGRCRIDDVKRGFVLCKENENEKTQKCQNIGSTSRSIQPNVCCRYPTHTGETRCWTTSSVNVDPKRLQANSVLNSASIRQAVFVLAEPETTRK